MSNTFQYQEDLIIDTTLLIRDRGIMINLADNTAAKQQFVQRQARGQTVQVNIPPQTTGALWNGTGNMSATTRTETTVDVTIEYFAYHKVDLTGLEHQFSITDRMSQLVEPALNAVLSTSEEYLLSKLNQGYARNIVGTAGVDPSTLSHISAAETEIFDNTRKNNDLVSVVNSTTWSNFYTKDFMNNKDYRDDGPTNLANNYLGKTANTTFYRSPFCGTFTRGDVGGTVTLNGDPGATNTFVFASLTEATGTIYAGTRFTVADDSSGTIYTILENATIAANAATVTTYPAAHSSVATGKVVTFQTAHKENIVYNPASVAFVMLPVVPDVNVFSYNYQGMGMSLIEENTSGTNLSKTWTFGAWIGAKVLDPNFGAIMQG